MAVELEQEVMKKIGFSQHYSWHNGSGSCQYARNEAVARLTEAANGLGLSISKEWIEKCKEATRADDVNSGKYGLTNTWITCSYAIQDAIHRNDGDKGFSPAGHEYRFWSDKERNEWNRRNDPHRFMHSPFHTNP